MPEVTFVLLPISTALADRVRDLEIIVNSLQNQVVAIEERIGAGEEADSVRDDRLTTIETKLP